MARLRIDAWIAQSEGKPYAQKPTFVRVSQDPERIPWQVASALHGDWNESPLDDRVYLEALHMEERWFRARATEMLRKLNRIERRAGRPRIEYLMVVERGPKNGTLHVHILLDRLVRVEVWRKVAYAAGIIGAPGRGGRGVKAKQVTGKGRGAAAYVYKLAKYALKDAGRMTRPKGAKVLMHSHGCLPSLSLWRAYRAIGHKWTVDEVMAHWTPKGLAELRKLMKLDEASRLRWRVKVDAGTSDGARAVRETKVRGGIRSELLHSIAGVKSEAAAKVQAGNDDYAFALTHGAMREVWMSQALRHSEPRQLSIVDSRAVRPGQRP